MYGRKSLSRFDWVMFLITLALLTIGVIFIWSASSKHYAYKQILWIIVGLVIFVILLRFDYIKIVGHSYFYYFIGLCSLIVVFFFGVSIRGSRRWLDFGPVSFQPSEFIKIILILTLAKYLTYKRNYRTFQGVFYPLILTIVPMALVAKQPDLGTAMLLMPIFFSMLFVTGAKLKHLLSIVGSGLASFPLLWLFLLKDYQKDRIIGFLWPEKAADIGAGYHKLQSLIAIGSGGLFGSGWGEGTQTQLKILPERHTDFIFSVIAEEWGFILTLFVLFLFLAFLAIGIGIASVTRETTGRLISVGVVTMFTTQILLNVAMCLGIAPISGFTLPFVSYGGSSILSSFIALSFLINVKMRTKIVFAQEDFY
ncbi:MAG TPA: rod shape-determining protein RodA [Candidatus Brocadiia bacterium]|nr:rod shape-determining protein RodA [Candidatus Brocadiales bacterium]